MYRSNYGEYRVDESQSGERGLGNVHPIKPERNAGRPPPDSAKDSGLRQRVLVDRIYKKYHGLLMKFLRERLPNQEEAEDVAQEVYYRIVRREDLEALEYPKAFVMKIAKNLLIDLARLRSKHFIEVNMQCEDLEAETEEQQYTPEAQLEGEELLKLTELALTELSPKCQAIFIMNRVDGITFRQIAKELNLSQSMVEKYMRQALNHLILKIEAGR
jgi:RNA polymerase sigma factor (sigma-70 family)